MINFTIHDLKNVNQEGSSIDLDLCFIPPITVGKKNKPLH